MATGELGQELVGLNTHMWEHKFTTVITKIWYAGDWVKWTIMSEFPLAKTKWNARSNRNHTLRRYSPI